MADVSAMTLLSRRTAVLVFVAFAFAYFLSSLIRAITATLSPTLTQEFALSAQDLGLLAGEYLLLMAMTSYLLCTVAAYAYFVATKSHNPHTC
jgi:sugar phosphate permease